MFEVTNLKYSERNGNLDICAKGVVKSNKFFPTYIISNKDYIFKPLSKTKPLTTGLFSVSEVFWSYIINRFFMDVPQYKLAICNGYSDEVPKYYEYGSLVPNILSNDEHLVNLLEYFMENPDEKVDINNYTNYCMMFYDYTNILSAKIFSDNYDYGSTLAFHILLSILKGDQNYHYENVAFVCDKDNKIIKVSPMIDHEFSTMFLYPDHISNNTYYLQDLTLKIHTDGEVVNKNIRYIFDNYPNVIDDFLTKLIRFKEFLKENENFSNTIYFNELKESGFLFDCNSNSYMIGIERYKENNENRAKFLENCILPINISEKADIIFDEIIYKGIISVVEEIELELMKLMGKN